MKYDKDNFYTQTKLPWFGCNRPARKPDYISRTRRGFVSSMYWYTPDGVIRWSYHWSHINLTSSDESLKDKKEEEMTECIRVGDCFWILKTGKKFLLCGFCPWKRFKGNPTVGK